MGIRHAGRDVARYRSASCSAPARHGATNRWAAASWAAARSRPSVAASTRGAQGDDDIAEHDRGVVVVVDAEPDVALVVLEQVGELAERLGQAPASSRSSPRTAQLARGCPRRRTAGRGEGEVVEAAHRLGGDVGRI